MSSHRAPREMTPVRRSRPSETGGVGSPQSGRSQTPSRQTRSSFPSSASEDTQTPTQTQRTSGNTSSKKNARSESVKVAVRCRPMSQSENERGCTTVVDVDPEYSCVRVTQNPDAKDGPGGSRPQRFTFDYVYPSNTTQAQVFNETAKPIVDSVLQGYNGTIFAYGQTGTGKTHTMEGVVGNEELQGIMPNSFRYLFERVAAWSEDSEFLVKASFLEIYLDEIYDLLNRQEKRKKMDLKKDPEKGVFVKGLSSEIVKSPAELLSLLVEGQKQRRVGATAMNLGSSRSHCVYTIVVEASSMNPTTGESSYRQGKLNFVDLAGSERQSKSKAEVRR